MGKQNKSKKTDSLGKGGKVSPVQIAFIVDRYLSDNSLTQTRSIFRTEASSLISKSPLREVSIYYIFSFIFFFVLFAKPSVRVFNFLWDVLGTEEFVEFGGDIERVYMSQGAEGDFGSRKGAFGARKIQGSGFFAWYARCHECL
jgi:hypothetical protein